VKEIPLTNSATLAAVVDDDDFDLVASHKWYGHAERRGDRVVWYAETTRCKRRLSMHRLIAGAAKGELVDHRDGNGLNNTRSNIRKCTAEQNGSNRGPASNNTSGFKGVTKHKKTGKWQAAIRHRGRSIYLGLFDDAAVAHEAYCRENAKIHGSFARGEPFEPTPFKEQLAKEPSK
jgi:hypothetical protein